MPGQELRKAGPTRLCDSKSFTFKFLIISLFNNLSKTLLVGCCSPRDEKPKPCNRVAIAL